MDVLVSHIPLQCPAHARIPAGRSSSSGYSASLRENGSTTTSGLPDSAYTTACHHYIIEREARAYRRAYVYATLAKFLRLRQSIELQTRAGLTTLTHARPSARRLMLSAIVF